MRVRFFATIRNLTGCAETEISSKETAGALARSLCELYGEALRKKVFPNGEQDMKPGEEKFGPEIIILINGRHVNHLGGSAASLKSDDLVDIFPLVAGG